MELCAYTLPPKGIAEGKAARSSEKSDGSGQRERERGGGECVWEKLVGYSLLGLTAFSPLHCADHHQYKRFLQKSTLVNKFHPLESNITI